MTIPSVPSFVGSYQPPDVYVADITGPLVTAQGTSAQYLAVCGPALGFRTAVESFLISAAAGVPLTFTGVFTSAQAGPPAIAAPVVTVSATGVVLAPGTDYTLTVTPDPGGDSSLAVTTVTRSGTSTAVADGQQVTVSYAYADVTYYQPQVFTDFGSVQNAYGPPLMPSAPSVPGASQVANPLSFAAQVAFLNGANTIIAVALNPGDGNLEQQLAAAYAKLATTFSASILVPVFPDDMTAPSGSIEAYSLALAQDLDAACATATASGFPRRGFFGLPRNFDEGNLAPASAAQAIADRRLSLMYPEIVQVFNGQTNQVFGASACYLAVAAGALLSSLPIDTGLTRQVLSGFSGLTPAEVQAMTPSVMNTLAAAGLCIVMQDRNGNLVIRHGLTTDMSALNYREISLVRQADALLTSVQAGMESAGIIGQPITAETPATIQGILTSILEQDVTLGIIQAYSSITVTQSSALGGDPTIMVCSFTYQPAVPLNFIVVTFSIDLTSGLVSQQSAANAAATG
jgi:hypothetical protein